MIQPKPNLGSQEAPQSSGAGDYMDCLVDLVETAEKTQGSLEDHPDLTWAMDKHILVNMPDGAIEMKCGRCAVMCTIKYVGDSAMALLHNREECPERRSGCNDC